MLISKVARYIFICLTASIVIFIAAVGFTNPVIYKLIIVLSVLVIDLIYPMTMYSVYDISRSEFDWSSYWEAKNYAPFTAVFVVFVILIMVLFAINYLGYHLFREVLLSVRI